MELQANVRFGEIFGHVMTGSSWPVCDLRLTVAPPPNLVARRIQTSLQKTVFLNVLESIPKAKRHEERDSEWRLLWAATPSYRGRSVDRPVATA